MSRSMWAWRIIIPGFGLIACLSVSYYSTLADSSLPETKDATVVAKPRTEPRVVAEGRIAARPGAEVTVGTEAGGLVINLPVSEKARVRKGDLLVEFQADDQKAALLEAEAKLLEAEAEFSYQNGEFQRRSKAKTEAKQFVTELEGTRRDLALADAHRKAANAAIARARSSLARTRVLAPIDGVVLARYVQPGEIAVPGSRLVTICDLSQIRVEAEVDEFDTDRVAPGDPVTITAEGFDGTGWKGTVEEVPDRVAERNLRPEDPGRPSDTRVLLVKIAPDQPLPIRLGQQVEVEIRHKP